MSEINVDSKSDVAQSDGDDVGEHSAKFPVVYDGKIEGLSRCWLICTVTATSLRKGQQTLDSDYHW